LRLPAFTWEQVEELARRHELIIDNKLAALLNLVNGHPYLVRLIMYSCKMGYSPEKLYQNALTPTGIFYEHLRRLDLICREHPAVKWALEKVLAHTQSTELTSTLISEFPQPKGLQNILFQLERLGMIYQDGNQVALQCNLYRQYFDKPLK
jgi:hypothetical protein